VKVRLIILYSLLACCLLLSGLYLPRDYVLAQETPQPSSPVNGAVDVPVEGAALSWSGIEGEEVELAAYEVQVSKNKDFSEIVASGTVTSNKWTINTTLDYATTYYWRVKFTKPMLSNWSGIFAFTTVANRCPANQPHEGTTTYETRTYTAASASKWVSTSLSLIEIYGHIVGAGVWQRVVTYSVTIKKKVVSVCYPNLWSLFWATDGCSKQVTVTTPPATTEKRTQTKPRLPLTRDPPSSALPKTFKEIHVYCTSIPEIVGSVGWALEFPLFTEGENALVALAPGYDFGAAQFADLADAFASEPDFPPEAAWFIADCKNIAAGFSEVSLAFANKAPTEESFMLLANGLLSFQQDIDALGMPEYASATPYLAEAAHYLSDATLQTSLGLDTEEEQVAFLQDLQSFGISLVSFSQAVLEPTGIYPPPGITEVSPATGFQGEMLSIAVAGNNFTGATGISLGDGITVTGFNVDSPTRITAEISIDANAPAGTRDIKISAPQGEGALSDAFTVNEISEAFQWWIFVAVLAFIIIVAIIIFFVVRRTKKPA
jgi:hypothetical protein